MTDISVGTTTSTTMSITWTSAGSVVDSYEVTWKRNTSKECPNINGGNATTTGSYTSSNITGLQEGSNYTITVTASNAAGSTVSVPFLGMTREAGDILYDVYILIDKYLYHVFFLAPSASPSTVRTSSKTISSITVLWGSVDCIHRNGEISGYSVQYGVQGSGSTQTMSVTGGTTSQANITGLISATNYSFEVAAVNSAGTGMYSDPITSITLGERIIHRYW